MDMSENDKFGLEKPADHQSSSLQANWQLGASSMNLVSANASVGVNPVIPMTTSQCPSVTTAEPFNAGLWNRSYEMPISFAFAQSNVPITANSINCLPIGKPEAIPSSCVFIPNVSGVIQTSLPHFPVDSAFIERAARFSCFNGDNLSGTISNTLGTSPFMASYSIASRDAVGTQLQITDFNMMEAKDISPPVDRGSNNGSPVVNQKISTHENSYTEGSQDANTCSADAAGDSSPSVIGGKKRRMNQDNEMYRVEGGTAADNSETKLKGGSDHTKSGRKHAKDSPEAPKEDYVHVRARRGQATNSHSLAERVRREKISERMKYLQDLVPGCSKVTGKAVMLDEIINYVQSLQRQVEFLSMKLAAVNPRLEYNLEALLAKDLFHSQGAPLSISGFSRETMHPLLRLQQQSFIQAGASGIANPSDSIRSVMNAQLGSMTGYKDPSLQMQNHWDQDIQNAMQMPYDVNHPPNAQELTDKSRNDFET